jgi:hypothetical protein
MPLCVKIKLGFLYTLLLMLCLSQKAIAQSGSIKGRITDSAGAPVAGANIILQNTAGRVITFTSSDVNGVYSIRIPDSVRRAGLFIAVSSIGYKKAQFSISSVTETLNVRMEETYDILKEVKVKTQPLIRYKGDTLSYDVASFARKEDISIGDVIKHLPGMAVNDNGQISFNGKSISNLYIQGDDLMDGRYGLATKVITKDMIKSIDVLQNFQPIQVLKKKLLTDDVAVNLILKDENSLKVTGQAMAGAGLPAQYDAALNLMMFNKTFKMLNSMQANNSGIDYRDDFNKYNQSDLLNALENTHPVSLLSDMTVGPPDIPRRNFYRNRSAVLNANNLYNTKDSLQLRFGLQLFTDRNRLDYALTSETYIAGDTIHYNERQSSIQKPFVCNASLTAMVNKTHYYLNNNLRIGYATDNNASDLIFNNYGFAQHLSNRTYDISNDFQLTPAVRSNNILNLRWYVNYYTAPQRLNIDQGIDSNILNGSVPYNGLVQEAQTPVLLNNLSAFYLIGGARTLRQIYQAGIINEWQDLSSTLTLFQKDGSAKPYAGDPGNNLTWQRHKVYVSSSYEIVKKNWQAGLKLPLAWQTIHYSQDEYMQEVRRSRILFTPAVHVKIFTSPEDYLTAGYTSSVNMGNIAGVYKGMVLGNYRSLYANDADLQTLSSSSASLNYNFQRNIVMFFSNFGISYSSSHSNSILSNVYTNTVVRSILLPFANTQKRLSANAGFSKYVFALKTTVSLRVSWQHALYSQLLNDSIVPSENTRTSAGLGLSAKPLKNFTLVYNGDVNWTHQLLNNPGHTAFAFDIMRIDQSLGLTYAASNNLFGTVHGRSIYNTRSGGNAIGYAFLDASIRYKMRKPNADLAFELSNITNITAYELFTITASQFSSSSFGIRGRMGIVRITFNL